MEIKLEVYLPEKGMSGDPRGSYLWLMYEYKGNY